MVFLFYFMSLNCNRDMLDNFETLFTLLSSMIYFKAILDFKDFLNVIHLMRIHIHM